MRILIIALGSYGDVLPLLGLALEFQQRGYPITFFSNDHFAPHVRRFGLDFVALSSSADFDALTNHPDLWNKYKGWQLIGSRLVSEALRKAYTVLCPYAVPDKTLMISSTLGFPARLLQETQGISNATVHLSPGVFHSAFEPPKVPGLCIPRWFPVRVKRVLWNFLHHGLVDPIVKPDLNRFRKELGLSPVSKVFHEWLHSPDLTVGLFPPWFAAPQPDWPPQTRLTTFPLFDDAFQAPLPDEVQQFLEQGGPPLVFTPGSANKFGGHFFAEGAKACQVSGRRGLFLTRYPEQLPSPLPPGIKHYPYVPLSQVLFRCAALIHHGGVGTCAQAFRAGIPQIIQPLNFDQFDNGARVVKLGVGQTLSPRSFRAAKVAKALEELLASEVVKTQCMAVADHFRGIYPLEETCDLIERVLLKRRGEVDGATVTRLKES